MTNIKSALASVAMLAVLLVGGATLALAQESKTPGTAAATRSH